MPDRFLQRGWVLVSHTVSDKNKHINKKSTTNFETVVGGCDDTPVNTKSKFEVINCNVFGCGHEIPQDRT